MKAIVNGHRFDTDSATCIGEAEHGYVGQFTYWLARLYKTPRGGAYFLAGQGGAMTRFARTLDGKRMTGAAGVVPLTPGEAQAWAREHLPGAIVEAEFGS